jgi:hypothetical protein
MIDLRRLTSMSTALLLVPLAVSAVAIGVLLTFPSREWIWDTATWTLLAAAAVLAFALPLTAYALVKTPAARTWPKWTAFVLATLYMATLAFNAIF